MQLCLKALLAAGVTLVAALGTVLLLEQHHRRKRAESEHMILKERLQHLASRVQSSILLRADLTRSMGALVALNPELDQDSFASFAEQVIQRGDQDGIRSLQLARDSVVSHIYPMQGNRAAMGHDLLADPARAEITQRAIESGSFTVDGPYELRQGGVSLVARTPIYLPGRGAKTNQEQYWGLGIVLFDLDSILASSRLGLEELSLRAAPGFDNPARHLYGSPELFAPGAALASIELPGASWEIAARASAPYRSFLESWTLLGTGVLASLLLASLVWLGATRRARLENSMARSSSRLASSELRQRTVMEATPVGLFQTDLEGNCTYVNPSWCEISGLSMEDSLGEGWLRAIHPEDKDKVARVWSAFVKGSGAFHFQYRFLQPLGGVVWTEGSAVKLFDASGEPVGYTGSVMDVSARIEADMARRKLESRMLHAQKLESLGVLAGGIAHDFNNLLVAIQGNAELALAKSAPASDSRACLLEIEVATKRAAELCDKMLTYAGKGVSEVQALDLNSLVRESEMLLSASVTKGVAAKYLIQSNPLYVEADVTQLRQILMNLVINACESMQGREGGVRVRTSLAHYSMEELQALCQDAIPAGPYVCLEVEDDGCGMEGHAVERIFEPFYSTKFSGRGLGMSAVLGIVRSHKGFIRIWSEVGKGTRFSVLLPQHLEPEQAVASIIPEPALPAAASGSNGLTVLLVDDEELVLRCARRLLLHLGYEVHAVSDGKSALELFESAPEAIDMAILDRTMPRMSGEQCFHGLRSIRADLPVLFASGYSQQDWFAGHDSDDSVSFIGKPFRISELAHKLNQIKPASPAKELA